jgi:Protein of unknown function (DUF4231)
MSTAIDSFLTERYKDQVEWYSSRATTNKRLYVVFQWTVIGFSSIVPALVVGLPESFKWLTASLSVVVAIGTAAIKTFKYQELWLNYRTISETLKKEHVFYTHSLGDYNGSEEPDRLFIERVETLISRENSLWVISMSDEDRSEKHAK